MNAILNSNQMDESFINIPNANNPIRMTQSSVCEYSSKDSESSSPISTSLPVRNPSTLLPSIHNIDTESDQQRNARLAGPTSKKVKFTKAEDVKLMMLVQEYSTKDWKTIAEHLYPRTARQCRERWTNYVNPSLSKDPWSKEEDMLLVEKHNEFGNRWKLIERYFPGRSKNNIKHRWSIMKDLHIAPDAPPKHLDSNTAVASNGYIDFPLRSSRSTHSPVSLQTLQLMRAVTQQQKMISEATNNSNNSNSLPIFQMQQQQKLLIRQAIAAAHAAVQNQTQLTLPSVSSLNDDNPSQSSNDLDTLSICLDDSINVQNSSSTTVLPSIHNFTSNAQLLSVPVISSPMPIPSISSVLISPSLKFKNQSGETGDHLKLLDRILDQHEVTAAPEIDKPDMWTFPEESYF